MLKSGLHRIVIRKSINDIRVQVVQYDRKGDITRLEDRASSLKRLGWKAHCANMPAAYLIGYKIGRKMLASGIKQAVADIVLQSTTKGNSLFAVVRGAKDAGIGINLGEEASSMDVISGKNIADYAKLLKNDKERYQKQFSAYLKNGLEPEKIEEHFRIIKEKLDEDGT